MPTQPLFIRLNPNFYKEIHDAMTMILKDEYNITRFRMFEGTSKQDWYRILLRAGLDAKMTEFGDKKKELGEDENQDGI